MTRPIRVLALGPCPELEHSELPLKITALQTAELRTSFSQKLKGFEIAVLDADQDPAKLFSFLRFFKRLNPQCPTLMLARPDEISTVEEALRHGLQDFLIRCADPKTLTNLLTHSIEKALQNSYLKQRLHDSEQRFWTFFENSPVGMAVLNLQGVFEHINPTLCKMLDYRLDELRDRGLHEFLHPREHPVWEPALKDFAADQRDYLHLHQEFQRNDNQSCWTYGAFVILRDSDGSPGYILAVLTDKTEKKEIQKNLQFADKMQAMGRLAGGVAHDFNNLLTIVDSHCYIMQNALDDPDRLTWSIQRLRHATEKGGKLTRQLLTFGRLHSSKEETIHPNKILQDLRIVLESLFGKIVRVDLAMATDLREIEFDRGQFEQVIVNLAINARDAMLEGGTFTIRTYNLDVEKPRPELPDRLPKGAYTVIEVEDTGSGIAPEVKEKIFEPFFTTKEVGHGTGLGLATVQSVLAENEGAITVESEVGKGTRFQVFIPSARQRTNTPPKLRRARKGTPGLASETILLVEDEDDLRAPVKNLLESKGYHVLDAASGEAALALSQQFRGKIDLLLSDVIMPGIDGFEVARRLRQDRPNVEILLMSGYTAEVLSRNPAVMETHKLLQKPFGMHILSRTIREMLKKR